jgi:hypothetical protein
LGKYAKSNVGGVCRERRVTALKIIVGGFV